MTNPTRGSTLLEVLAKTVAEHGADRAIYSMTDDAAWSWAELADRARRVASGFAALGISAGDNVGLLLNNRREFYLADLAALMLGATPVSVYPTSAPEQVAYILADAGVTLLVTERSLAGRAVDFAGRTLVVDDAAFTSMQADSALAEIHRADPTDIVTIIYTSGTTGPPKGVELSHRALLAAVDAMADRTGLGQRGRVICWLPMAHVAARCASYYGAIAFGDEVTICPDPRQIGVYLSEVHPTWFFAVPRIWEKLKARVEAFIATMPEIERARVTRAITLGTQRIWMKQAGEPVSTELDQAIADSDNALSPIRRSIGLDRLTCAQVGAAPIAAEVVAFFHALGVPLAEIYGQSEGIVCSAPDARETLTIGTVGRPLKSVEVKLAEDSEILLRGELMMNGYHNRAEATASCYTEDGFFRTGDVGRLADGVLTIIDRKKELIVNAAGKNMSPANIEAAIKADCSVIAQVVAFGDRRPYNVALVALDPEVLRGRTSDDVHDEIATAIERGNARLSRVEQIKRYAILDDPWLPGGDELTPTLKLKRTAIYEKYAARIGELYAEHPDESASAPYTATSDCR
jgi:long-chain acyl-CoA synthetase